MSYNNFPKLKALRPKMDLDSFLIESVGIDKLPPLLEEKAKPLVEEVSIDNFAESLKKKGETTQIIEIIKETQKNSNSPSSKKEVEQVIVELPVKKKFKIDKIEKTEKEKEMEKLIRNMTESRIVRKRHKFKDNAVIFKKDSK